MALPSSSIVPPASITIPPGEYDVFINFRGIDTRQNFTSHLYAALCRNGLKTFIDSKGLRVGDKIHSLLDIIEGSKLAIIIFSENYASSTWCLEELDKILQCKKPEQIVPVFYCIDPAVVRRQSGSFREAFAKHEAREPMDKVHIWKASLTKAANLSGWHSRVTGPESELVDKIVEDVLRKLEQKSSTYFHGLIGIDSRVKGVESLLRLDSPDVCSVGIWGIGGIGKTTVAKAVFNHLYTQFEGFYFLENCKEEVKRHGKVTVVNNFLSSVLDEKSVHMGSLNLAFTLERLRRKRILVVFDDVDDSTLVQLQELVRHHDLFGLGSKVILTSRNKHVLRNFKVDEVYEVDGLNQDEGLRLFVFNAFKNVRLNDTYLRKSQEVVSYTKGHPLAIKVLSSTLLDREEEYWATVLNKLGKFLKPSLMNVLRISYDELSIEEQNIFLDISCCFKGEDLYNAKRILDSCYELVYPSIIHLAENALISIDKEGKIGMHDLLQEMSFHIIEERDKDPGKRSRLVNPDDVYDVLTKGKGTDAIEGISLDLSKSRNMELGADAFAAMTRLRILKFHNYKENRVQLPSCGLGYLPNELRNFCWEGFPSRSLPSNSFGKYLVGLEMPRSNVEQLWIGAPHLENLRHIDLTESQNLIETPDVSNAKNIEYIGLSGCGKLVTVHPSVQYLSTLRLIELHFCVSLRNLPSRLDSQYLQALQLWSCSNVQKFPELVSHSLIALCLNDGCPLSEIPPLEKFKHLKILEISTCADMTRFPEISSSIESLQLYGTAIQEIPSSIQSLTSLWLLDLKNNKHLSTLPTSICKLKSLYELDLSNCLKLEEFPEILEAMECLNKLKLSGCENLKRLPTDISNLTSLQWLYLSNCKLIRFIPKLPQSVKKLHADNCESLETLLSCCENLCYLWDCLFVNCCRLDDKTREILMALGESRIKGNNTVRVCLPESEIPTWFNFRSLGSSVTLTLPFNHNHVAGITCCIVYECGEDRRIYNRFKRTSPEKEGRSVFVRVKCYDKDNNPVQRQSSPAEGMFPFKDNCSSIHDFDFQFRSKRATKSDHLMLYHTPFSGFIDWFQEEFLSDCSKLSFEFLPVLGDDILVKACAVHLHFGEDSGCSGEEYYSCNDEGYFSCNDNVDDSSESTDTEEVLPHAKRQRLS